MCNNLLCHINLIFQLTILLQVQINSMYGHVRENQLVVKSSTSSSPSITGANQNMFNLQEFQLFISFSLFSFRFSLFPAVVFPLKAYTRLLLQASRHDGIQVSHPHACGSNTLAPGLGDSLPSSPSAEPGPRLGEWWLFDLSIYICTCNVTKVLKATATIRLDAVFSETIPIFFDRL